ncbi:glutathione S-transferase T3-like [Cornus florida]|uniref:glutathione S-transferase T3-like n=1 Tax=Cornus florida TaxID=4283 RepID=UPI00289EBEC9|nr:glutathione S-transferase T3-like [Cornus florida]
MIGEDPVTGTDQSMGTLWQRIHAHWIRQLGDKITEERSHGALMNRFSNFQRDVNKFSRYYKNVHDNPISGYNEYDMMNAVRELYELQQKKKFKYEHCWNVLRDSKKWQMHCNVNENPTRRPMKRGVDLDINEPRNWSESTPTTPGSSTPTVSTPGSVNLGDDDTPVDTEGSNM